MRAQLAVVVFFLLMPTLAWGYLVDLDVQFNGFINGHTPQRRGPEFDEPYPGPFDATTAEITVESGNPMVVIEDTNDANPELLYWGFFEDISVDSGLLVMESRFAVTSATMASLAVAGPTGQQFFKLNLENDLTLSYQDTASPSPVDFRSYTPDDFLEVRLEFVLDTGRYAFILNGDVIFANKTHGATGAIHRMVLGFEPGDSGAFMLQDDFLAYRTIHDAEVLLLADFETKPLGPIGTGGAALGEPVFIPPTGANVVTGGFSSKSLEICDDTNFGGRSAEFELLGSQEVLQGTVCVSAELRFDELDRYEFLIREQAGATSNFASISFFPDGEIRLGDAAGQIMDLSSYSASTTLSFRLSYRMQRGLYYVWIDDELLVRGRAHAASGGIGSIYVGYTNDINFDGCVRVDDLTVTKFASPATSSPEATPGFGATHRLRASPNPFNPTTQLRFELPRTSMASLRLYDATGRWVTTLLERPLAAGSHLLSWNGRDAAGHPVKSGVYFAQLRAGSQASQQKLVLVK